MPVFAWKGETVEEYWDLADRIFDWSDEAVAEGGDYIGPTMILDDGGDASLLVHKGVQYERAGRVPETKDDDGAEQRALLDVLRRSLDRDPERWTRIAQDIRGVSEETTTGVHRLHEWDRDGELLFPAISVNDSVTKSKFDNRYGIRHSLVDGLNRGHRRADRRQDRLRRRVRRRRQGRRWTRSPARARASSSARSTRSPRCRRRWTATRSCRSTRSPSQIDILITTTGNEKVVTVDDLLSLKHLAIVANIGHFDTEIDIAGLETLEGAERIRIKPQVDEWELPNGRSIIVLSEGRLMNLGNATGHPSFVMSMSFTNQVLAQLELWTTPEAYPVAVATLPRALDEEVARLHLDALGVRLTRLSKKQAKYLGVDRDGPFKPDTYRVLSDLSRKIRFSRKNGPFLPAEAVSSCRRARFFLLTRRRPGGGRQRCGASGDRVRSGPAVRHSAAVTSRPIPGDKARPRSYPIAMYSQSFPGFAT